MRRQRKINTNLNFDSHTRKDYTQNAFQEQASQSSQFLIGEIEYPQPEPLFRQNMVTVKMARGGRISSVAYPGAFIDPITGNLHGTYEGPYPGQMVTVGFENGNSAAPMVINRYPYQGAGNTLTESKYILPQTSAGFHNFDVLMGHFSGSYLSFNTGIAPSTKLPGSITINAITDCDMFSNTNILLESLVTAEVKSAVVTLTGSTYVALNGTSNYAVKYTELKSAFDTLKTELNNFITVFNLHTHPVSGVTAGGATVTSAVSATPGTPAAADMSASQNTTVLM